MDISRKDIEMTQKRRTRLNYANTIEDLDTLVMDYMKYVIKFQIQQYDGTVTYVPIVYNGAERWVQVRRRNYLVDQTYNVLFPVISFSRTSIKQRDQNMALRMWTNRGRNYIVIDNKYSKHRPYSKFDLEFSRSSPQNTKYKVALPMAVQLNYQFQIFTDRQQQMNKILQYFMIYNKQWWVIGYKRIRMMFSQFGNTTQVEAQGQRLIKANFSATGYGTLFPYDIYQDTPPISEQIEKDIIVDVKQQD